MISYLQDHSSEGSALPESRLREILCKAVSKTISMDELGFELGSWRHEESRHEPALKDGYPYTPPRQFVVRGLLEPAFLPAAAAAIGDITLMEEALSSAPGPGSAGFYGKSLFGDIIANSVAFDHPGVLKAYSDYLDGLSMQLHTWMHAPVSHYNWESLVIHSMKMGSNSWVKLLLDFAHKQCSRSHHSWKFGLALTFAIDNCTSSTTLNLLDSASALVESNDHLYLDIGQFTRACARHNEGVVLRIANLLEGGVNHIWRNSTVLTLAVQHGSASVVAALVDAGAWVDGRSSSVFQGTSKFRTIVVPIEEAMKRGKCEIIQALLDRGATVTDLEIHSRKMAVYNVLRDAKMMETSEYVPTYAEKYTKTKTQAAVPPPSSILPDPYHPTALSRRLAAPSTSTAGYVRDSAPSPENPPRPMASPLFPLDLGGASYDSFSTSHPRRLYSTPLVGPIDPSSIDTTGYVRDSDLSPDDPPRPFAFAIAPPHLGGGLYYNSSMFHPPRQDSTSFVRPINPPFTGMDGHVGGSVHTSNHPAPAFPAFTLAQVPYEQLSSSHRPPHPSRSFKRPQ
jgi:hypothetical protein